MKNQYVCDIGDFGKYLLLNSIAKPFSKDKILSLGINWYFTADDDRNDGKHTCYLLNDKNNIQNSLCPSSNKIYKELKKIFCCKPRTVESIEKGKVLPRKTVFFSEPVPADNKDDKKRSDWVQGSIKKLSKRKIIFLDPDNGIKFNEQNGNNSIKHVLLSDLEKHVENTDSNIIIYHHAPIMYRGGLVRFSKDTIYPKLSKICYKSKIKSQIKILWYHRGTARLYIFIIRQNKVLINNRIEKLLSCKDARGELFTEIKNKK